MVRGLAIIQKMVLADPLYGTRDNWRYPKQKASTFQASHCIARR